MEKYNFVSGNRKTYYDVRISEFYFVRFYQICNFMNNDNKYYVRSYLFQNAAECNGCQYEFVNKETKIYTLDKKELKQMKKMLSRVKNTDTLKIVYRFYDYKDLNTLPLPTVNDILISISDLTKNVK